MFSRLHQSLTSNRYTQYYFPLLVFASIFIFYTYPMGLSDYWWHMSSGRWIWEHGAIPNVDQFTYSYPQDEDIRRTVILQAYYLGQVSFYFIYSWFGIWGLLLYKASLLTLPLWLLWRFLCFKGVDTIIALVILLPLPLLLHRFDELRAVVFSFIGAIAVLYLIELILEKLRDNKSAISYLVILPVLMLLWANLHRGFLIGWVLLGAYLGYEWLKFLAQKKGFTTNSLSINAIGQFSAVAVLSIVITFINPNGVKPIIANSSELSGPFMQVIDEYFPLWTYADLYNIHWMFFGCAVIAVSGLYFILRARKDMYWVHAILFAGFAYQGLITFRFSYFLGIMCVALAAAYYREITQTLMRRYANSVLIFAYALLLAVSWISVQRSAFMSSPWERQYFPSAAVQYILQQRPPQQLFNAFEYGGYLGWKLFPDYKIFIDQRNLDYQVYQEYAKVQKGDYADVFAKYNIKTVLFYVKQPVLSRVPPIVAALINDQRWAVVYVDSIAIVLVDKHSNAKLAELNKQQVVQYINSLTLESTSTK